MRTIIAIVLVLIFIIWYYGIERIFSFLDLPFSESIRIDGDIDLVVYGRDGESVVCRGIMDKGSKVIRARVVWNTEMGRCVKVWYCVWGGTYERVSYYRIAESNNNR